MTLMKFPLRAQAPQLALILLPRPWIKPEAMRVLKDQSLDLGDAKPFVCESVYRDEGNDVYVKGDIRWNGRTVRIAPYWHRITSLPM